MTETKNTGEKTLSVNPTKTLTLKRGVEQGVVRQSFSHGRSKAVVVEKVKRRALAPGEAKTAEPIGVAERAPARQPKASAASPAAVQSPALSPAAAPKSSGVVLRTLTDEERNARAHALADARVREAEERRIAEEEGRRRADREGRERLERDAAEARKREEEDRRRHEEETKRKAEQEAKKRFGEDETKRAALAPGARAAAIEAEEEEAPRTARRGAGAARPAPAPKAPRAGAEKRRGRLTLVTALKEDEERQRSDAAFRRRVQRLKRQVTNEPKEKLVREVTIPEAIAIQELANRMAERAVDVIRLLMKQGQMVQITDVIDADTAQLVAEEMGHSVRRVAESDVEEGLFDAPDDPANLVPRPPVVTIMGHVDHGKTSLLDAIRSTEVAAGEAGGITQHIGAYQVTAPSGAKITFIDTPGHAAFTAMRARGAKVTDLVVLVVAADDGVMPQTVEAIHHAKAAKVPIIVAINKIDRDNANPERVHQQLAEQGIVTRHYGGEHECVHLSAKTGKGIDDLLTTIVLSSDILELKANPDRNAIGTIVDAHLERGRGPVATVLVQAGTLKVGDDFVCGHIYGRVRALADDRGRSVTEAPPATPVVVSGMSEVPQAGDIFQVVGSEKVARQIALTKLTERRAQEAARDVTPRITLEDLARRAKEGEVKELSLVVKADAQGTLEAVLAALQKIEDPVVAIKIVGQGVGAVSDSDLLLASVSSAIIVCFNLKPTPASTAAAERAKVEVRYYDVIYKLTEDVERAAKGLREPTYRQIREGRVEVITPIKIPRLGVIAGSRVVEGKVSRGGWVKLFRAREMVHEGRINSLKHFKEDVREMPAGQECGIGLEGWEDFQPGDTMETYRLEREEI